MERSIIKNGALLVVGLVAAVLLSCGTDAKRSVSGPEAFGSLAPRIVFKRASSQAVINIPSLVATVSITLTINGHDTTVSAPRAQGFLEILRVPVGLCLVTVTGKDTAGRIIYSGSIPATILENQTAVPEVDVRQAVPILLYFDSPKKNMVVSNSSITLTGTVTFGPDIRQATGGFLIDGSAPAQTGALWTKNVTLTEGPNKFKFSIETTNGNILRDSLTVIYSLTSVDAVGPSLTISPLTSDTTPLASIKIKGTVSDPTAPVRVLINGTAATVSGSQFALLVSLSEGKNTLIVEAFDALNNKTSQTLTVYSIPSAIDFIKPDLMITAPGDSDTVATHTARISGTANDQSGVSVTVNGQTATIDLFDTWSVDVVVDSAINHLVVIATDKSTRQNTTTVRQTLFYNVTVTDNVPPTVSIKSPGNLATTSLDSIDVSVEAIDAISGVASVKVNGFSAVYDTTQKRYIIKIKLNPGANTINAIATDTKGNADATQITVTYTPPAIDNQGPSITITDPVANSTVSSRTYTVKATVTDTSGVDSVFFSALADTSVWITAARLADTTFVADVAMGSAGAKTLWVKACDKASAKHWSRVRCTFNYVLPDLSNPVVVIKSPAPNTTVSTDTATIVATITDAGGIAKVKFNNDSTSATVTDSTYTYRATLVPGPNVFTIKARDVAGNIDSTKSVTITYVVPDITKPSVIITTPASNITVNTNTATIVATITDAGGIAKVKFNNDSTSATVTDSTYTYRATLGLGPNVFTIKARDVAGNTDSTKSVTITYVVPDITKPSVIITTPASNITVNINTATIVATITDAGGIAKVKFNNDSTSATVTDSTYTYRATLGAGPNVFTIKARDVAGNIDSTKSVTITYNAPPTAPTLFTPVTVSATSISVRWTKSAEPDFARYKLFWGLTASVGDGNAIGLDTAITAVSDTARTIAGLTPATIYYFKVAVLDGFPSTANSGVAIDTTPLNATVLSVIGDSIVRLSWSSVTEADRYVVYRRNEINGNYDSVAITTGIVWTNTGLATGTKYFYKIKAQKAGFVDAVFSNIDSATTWQAPVIATQPLSQTKIVGQAATFTVVASGIPAPTYQWRKNGQTIAGATISSYPISPVTLADSQWYMVTATNGMGSITSIVAKLTVVDTIVTDIEGNVYHTVMIGNQVWTKENLRVKKYNDGTAIPLVIDNAAWGALTTPAYCQYDNRTNVDSIKKWGALYNWYVVDSANVKKIAPAGWHVPTDFDWITMENYLIANSFNWDGTTTGNRIAQSLAAKTDWASYSTAGTVGHTLAINNRSGFSALPAGYRYGDGTFSHVGSYGYCWSATAGGASNAYSRLLGFNFSYLGRDNLYKGCGFSVRLVRD